MRNIILRGSSGVDISFKKIGRTKIVIKKSTTKDQIERLKVQYEKQLFLIKNKNDLFNIPTIINSGVIGESFFYEYQFIEGLTLNEVLRIKPLKNLMEILEKLVLIVEEFSSTKNFFEINHQKSFKDTLQDKIFSVSSAVGLDKELFELLLAKLESLNLPQQKTLYHGDLSFDNIIIDKKNQVWLIDCIGTFYPHYWTDISKLFQDIEGEWYHLKHGIVLDRNKNRKLTDYLKKRIYQFDADYIKSHNFLMAIVFLRILPYLKNKSKKEKILKKINNYLDGKIGLIDN